MNRPDLSFPQPSSNSPNYKLACDLGYELSKKEYVDMYNYAKLVRNEYLKASETSPTFRNKSSFPSISSRSSLKLNDNKIFYPEDLWIKNLREYFDSELKGISTPSYDLIKARELQAQNEIRKRRIFATYKLPEIPLEFSNHLQKYISSSESTEIIQKFNIPITVRELRMLRSPNWLNDEIINFYFELLVQRSKLNTTLPRLHIFNTFFYPKLKGNGFDLLKRWTRKLDIFSYDMILIPIHLGIHWCCAEINFKDRTIYYYDSLHNSNPTCLKLLQNYLIAEHLDKKGNNGDEEFDFRNWDLVSPKNIPCQQNGYDCGVFACIFAEYRSRNADFMFSQRDMNYFRDKISYEIITGSLITQDSN